MSRFIAMALPFLTIAAPAAATDFGIRVLGQAVVETVSRHASASIDQASTSAESLGTGVIGDVRDAASVAARFGHITRTWRSVEHNRAVGWVPNSYHFQGRALDVVRRRDVSHWEVAAALRHAGFHLIELLDEGDHSHFAFGRSSNERMTIPSRDRHGLTNWGIVEVRNSLGRTPAS
jgi:hypothetical protein